LQRICSKCGQPHQQAKLAARIKSVEKMGPQASTAAKEAVKAAALEAHVRSNKTCHVLLVTFREDLSRQHTTITCKQLM
jgi:hypothetical protein